MLLDVGHEDEADSVETGVLRMQNEEWEDPLLETRLMPAKHGAKAPTNFMAKERRVPSPFPYVKHSTLRPPPPSEPLPSLLPPSSGDHAMTYLMPTKTVGLPSTRSRLPSVLPSVREPMYSNEPTGSDVHAPIHRLVPGIPSSTELAARREPWVIPGTPPAFQPVAMPTFASHSLPAATDFVPAPRRLTLRVALLWVVALGSGVATMAIASGDLTRHDAAVAIAHAQHVVDAIIAKH